MRPHLSTLRHVLHVQRGRRRACVGGFPPLEDVDERRGTMSTVTRPSRHPTHPPPRPAPSPTPRPSRARPSRVAKGSVGGGARVFGGFLPLEDDACHESTVKLPSFSAPHTSSAPSRARPSRVAQGQRGGRRACVWGFPAAGRWRVPRRAWYEV